MATSTVRRKRPQALDGIRLTASVYPDDHVLRSARVLLAVYEINKRLTLQIAADLAERRERRRAST